MMALSNWNAASWIISFVAIPHISITNCFEVRQRRSKVRAFHLLEAMPRRRKVKTTLLLQKEIIQI
jgi:hypothetical protein